MRLSYTTLALLLGTLPVVIINVNYLIAASEGHVPWCVPYWDSCTSISATGREGIGYVFFKAAMLPIALCYWAYWRLAQEQLRDYGYQGDTLRVLGSVAVAALVLYLLALGLGGDNYQLVRRIGIVFYFGFTFLNQLLLAYNLSRRRVPVPGLGAQLLLCAFILVIGLLTVLLDALLTNYDDYEDAFEWNVALLMHCNFLLNWWGQRQLGRRTRAADVTDR